ncbi:hypothetical protein OE88DRAFT_809709 [Heliocybe sulcata]|uniref:F-box domain-containing protein n=1 Tax=Heliocybe sulcata TaxID=5364 RepID=A0A5C3MRF0_9AGAM|nr:hypothetical protein OE88DRAFT_809709 [Heliocybe sulcata]
MHHLLALPPELLDSIATHLDRREDVLSLALCCRCLHSLVSRTHLQYRDIRCRLGLSALWDRLASNDLRAGLLRSLTILPYDAFNDVHSEIRDNLPIEERVPNEYREYASDEAIMDSDRDDEDRLIRALKRMPNLRRFRWFRRPACGVADQAGHNIWETLNALGTIQELHILNYGGANFPGLPAVSSTSSFVSFRCLTSFNLSTNAFDEEGDATDATPLLHMLIDSCPDLQSLTLHLETYGYTTIVSADPLLYHSGWPNLHTLYLEGLHSTSLMLSTFLGSHPSLKDIHLSRMMLGSQWQYIVLVDGTIPDLHVLECSSHIAGPLLVNHRAVQRITSLRGIDLDDEVVVDSYFNYASDDDWWDDHSEGDEDFETRTASPWKSYLLASIRLHPTITSVWLETLQPNFPTSYVVELATAAPQITELSLPDIPPTPFDENEWIDALSHFPNLQYLRWYDLVFLSDYPPITEEATVRLRRFVEGCPTLQGVGDAWRMAVIIDRNHGGQIKWVFRQKGDSLEPVLLGSDETVYTA